MYAIGYDNRSSQRRQVYNDRRLYLSSADNPLYPVFVKAELLRGLLGPEWQRQRLCLQNSPMSIWSMSDWACISAPRRVRSASIGPTLAHRGSHYPSMCPGRASTG